LEPATRLHLAMVHFEQHSHVIAEITFFINSFSIVYSQFLSELCI